MIKAKKPHDQVKHQKATMERMIKSLRNFWEDVSGETRKRAEEYRKRAKKQEALKDGHYYTKAKEVITLGDLSSRVEATEDDFDAIKRTFEHPFYSTAIGEAKKFDPKQTSCKVDNRADRHMYGSDTISKASSLQTSDQDSETAKNRKRKLENIAVATTGDSSSADIAHLIPHSFACADFYRRLVVQMTGIVKNESWQDDNARALVHGLMLQDEDDGKWKRVRDTGVKHNRSNMVRIFAQKAYFDTWPKLLILPIMDLSEVIGYREGPYHALILAAEDTVYKQCGITADLPLASYQEIKIACSTLEAFVKACAYDVVKPLKDTVDLIGLFASLGNFERKRLEEGLQKSKELGTRIPKMRISENDVTSGNVRIGRAPFCMKSEVAHQACDPYALFLKAVAVESSMQGEKLLPGCPPLHDCDVCLEKELYECHCGFDDPGDAIPEEIFISDDKRGGTEPRLDSGRPEKRIKNKQCTAEKCYY